MVMLKDREISGEKPFVRSHQQEKISDVLGSVDNCQYLIKEFLFWDGRIPG